MGIEMKNNKFINTDIEIEGDLDVKMKNNWYVNLNKANNIKNNKRPLSIIVSTIFLLAAIAEILNYLNIKFH